MTRLEIILMVFVLMLMVLLGNKSAATGCNQSDDPVACLIRSTQ